MTCPSTASTRGSGIGTGAAPGRSHRSRSWLLLLGMAATTALSLSAAAAPGGEAHGHGPRAAAMGGAGVALAGVEAAFANPGMLAGVPDGGMLCWTPSRYGFAELADAAAAGVMSRGRWSFAAAVQRFGSDVYAEHRAGFGVAVAPEEAFAVGARAQALHIGIRGYGSAVVPLLDVGASLRLGDEVRLAFLGRSVNLPTVAGDERVPLELVLGVAWAHEHLLLLCDIAKEARWDADVRFGMEYRIHPALALRAGHSTLARECSGGFGLRHASFELGYAFTLHSELGATHTVGLKYVP